MRRHAVPRQCLPQLWQPPGHSGERSTIGASAVAHDTCSSDKHSEEFRKAHRISSNEPSLVFANPSPGSDTTCAQPYQTSAVPSGGEN